MQIKKINNDKLKVILSSHDLHEKNINVDSFLSSSIESQDLFFEILDLAEEKYSFSIENHKAIVEAISLDNNIFILTITKIKNDFKPTPSDTTTIYCFESSNDFFEFYSVFKQKNLPIKNTYIYEWNQQYYLLLNSSYPIINDQLAEYATPIKNPYLENFLIEHGTKIK